jgi:hypothetical protein
VVQKTLIPVVLAVIVLMTNCAAPPPDPFLAYISKRQDMLDERKAMIERMPPGPEKDKAIEDALKESEAIRAAIDRERQTRAMESVARSQARMAEPQSTPYVVPTPIQVQIVP